MSNTKRLVLIPLLVGLLLDVWGNLSSGLYKGNDKLICSINKPIEYLNANMLHEAKLEINEKQISNLYYYVIRIWNPTKISFKDVRIRICFVSDDISFEVLHIKHNTKPKKEFGEIQLLKSEEDTSGRDVSFLYERLNSKAEDKIVFLVNKEVPIEVYSNQNISITKLNYMPTIIGAIISTISCAFIFKRSRKKFRKGLKKIKHQNKYVTDLMTNLDESNH